MAKLYGLMRIGRDAVLRTTPNGKQVCNFSVAYNYGQKDGDAYPSQWVDVALWGDRAATLAPYMLKGSLHLFTLGDVHMEKYTDKDGYDAWKLSARVDDVELGPKREGQEPAAQGQRRPSSEAPQSAPAPRQAPPPQQRQAPQQGQAPQGRQGNGFDDMDDDIPF